MLSLQKIGVISSRLVKNRLSLHVLQTGCRSCSVKATSVPDGVTNRNNDLQNVTQRSEYVLEEAVEFSVHGPSSGSSNAVFDTEYQEYSETVEKTTNGGVKFEQSSDENLEETSAALNCHSTVNLYGHMQTNVPEPCNTEQFTHAAHKNMPGGDGKLLQKYVSDSQTTTHPTRSFHWSAALSAIAKPEPEMRTPEGIQGDDCVMYTTWIENCRRFGLTNCDNQLLEMKEGRKTLSQVLQEQEELIRKVAESYGNKAKLQVDKVSAERESFVSPCPQGIQGDDCVRFKLWLENCHRFDMKECDEQLESVQSGRKTLQQVFFEQENMIRKIVKQYQQKRSYSTSSGSRDKQEVGKTPPSSEGSTSSLNSEFDTSQSESFSTNQGDVKLSQRERLKRAVKDYGSTVIVFHIGISLMSLGGFYLAVSSGLDVVGLLSKVGIGQTFLESKLATGASTFVIAYAVHKLFAPVRIGITLTATPFIVGYLRRIGFLKVKAKA